MAVTVRKVGVFTPTEQPYVRAVGTQRAAKKAYLKNAGVWKEAWPLLPNPPQNVIVATPQVGEIVVVDGTWAAPAAGATAATSYRVRAVFTDSAGRDSPTSWVDKTLAQITHRFDNGGVGWVSRAGQKIRIEVVSVIAATTMMLERLSSVAVSATDVTSSIIVPPVPTSFSVSISECEMTQTWVHAGGVSLDYFQIQTWLTGGAVTTYTVGSTLRKWTTFPWNAAIVGRSTVNTQIRGVGPGGASAWVKVSGVMPGPVAMSNYGYSGGVSGSSLFCTLDNIDDGVGVYTQKYGAASALQSNLSGSTGKITVGYTNSFSHDRDNVTRYRLGFLPRNATAGPALGWTGRPQWAAWAIKMPNPVFIQPADCNTWWSIPIPGKWRTNPQAENWFYQGKSISGNSYGTLFFQNRVPDYFAAARVGYTVAIVSWDVYTKRTNTGGLVAAVALNVWTHARDNDIYDAAPGLVNGPSAGPSLLRDQKAWVPLSTSWWANMLSGVAKGISYYVDPAASDNQLRSEIGNVSNRYMILDKPTYGTTLDGQIPGTLRIYHDG